MSEMSKAELRALATKLGVEWDKKADDEDSLSAKIQAKRAEEAGASSAEPAFDVTKRAPLETKWDAGTKKNVKERSDCFGWLHAEKKEPCVSCSHAKWCGPLSEGADAAMKAAEAEAAEEVEEEVAEEEVIPKVAPLGAKSEKPGDKKKRKVTLTEESEFTLGFDKAFVAAIEDGGLRKVYRKLLKEFEGEEVTAGVILDAFGIETDEERLATLAGDLPGLVAKGDFVLVQ